MTDLKPHMKNLKPAQPRLREIASKPEFHPERAKLGQAPEDVIHVMERLHAAGRGSWLVGGAIRDLLMGLEPNDWDIATEATVDQLATLFERVIPVGLRHGTVQVLTSRRVVEVTAFSRPGREGLDMDLKRRDFTVNAMGLSYPNGVLLDPHGGRKDLRAGRLRAVGDGRKRFIADPLRVLRAARLISQHGFRVHRDTLKDAKREAHRLQDVAAERIREEMVKLLLGDTVLDAFHMLRRTGALKVVLPELLEGVRRKQNHYHRYDVYHHILYVVHYSAKRVAVRLAALLHDIAKPRVRFKKDGVFRFYGHEELGAEMAVTILRRWRMPEKIKADVATLIRNHMIIDTDHWGDAAVRRLIARTGPELMPDLLDLVRADRLTHTEADALLEELDRLERRIQLQMETKVPLRTADLAINGRDIMALLEIEPGPEVGRILAEARELVLQYPEKNERKILRQWLMDEKHQHVF